jgi:hypothetical protein
MIAMKRRMRSIRASSLKWWYLGPVHCDRPKVSSYVALVALEIEAAARQRLGRGDSTLAGEFVERGKQIGHCRKLSSRWPQRG